MTGHYVIESGIDGRTLVVTGPWSTETERALIRERIDALQLNYARGFTDHRLDFLSAKWGLRALDVLDRAVVDLEPLHRLSETLERLSVQAAPRADLDLSGFPKLSYLAGEWLVLKRTLEEARGLGELVTWRFIETDLECLRVHPDLERLTIKEALRLRTLSGARHARGIRRLAIITGRRLGDMTDVESVAASLEELQLQGCPLLQSLDFAAPLVNVEFLNVGACGDIASLYPLEGLAKLQTFHAWGSTRIVDRDLTPLLRLPQLRDVRMRDRRDYTPRLAEVQATLNARTETGNSRAN